MGPRGGIPDGWFKYSRVGKPITGTRFIAFKVPLKEALCGNLGPEERFTPSDLIRKVPNLGFVIDLTNTQRYYDPMVFRKDKIGYRKIFCQGHGRVPGQPVVDEFFKAADGFLQDDTQKERLLGVHCTHGLNRTGYLICKYMVERLGFAPENAIRSFEEARRHKIERKEYLREFEDCSHHGLSVNSLLPHPGTLGELMLQARQKKALLPPPPSLLPSPSYLREKGLLGHPQADPKGLLPHPSDRSKWVLENPRDSTDSLLGHSPSYSEALLIRPNTDALLPHPSSTKEPLLPYPVVSKEPLLPSPQSTKEALLPHPHSTNEPLLPPPGFSKDALMPCSNQTALLPSPSTPNPTSSLLTTPSKEPLLAHPLAVAEPLFPTPGPTIGRGRAVFRNKREHREPLLLQPPQASLPRPPPLSVILGFGRGRGRARGRPPICDEVLYRKSLLDEPGAESFSGDRQSGNRKDSASKNGRDRCDNLGGDTSHSRENRTLTKNEPRDYEEDRTTSQVTNGNRPYRWFGRGYSQEDTTVYRRSNDFAPRTAGSGNSSRSLRFNSTSYNRPS